VLSRSHRYRGAENDLAKKLIIFASQINNTRTVNRLFGLLDSIEMAIGAFEEKDPVSRVVAHIQVREHFSSSEEKPC